MDLREIREFLKDSFIYILIFVGVLFAFIYGISFQSINGSSMEPNYNNKDLVLLSKISYKLHKIERGDVVALTDKDGVLYIKRVIAVPGDNVYVKNNKLYINDLLYEEGYIESITDDFNFKDICVIDGCEELILPENKYFVMGDNRKDSYDSRYNIFGLIDKENILGKVIFKIWPLGFAK